MISQADIIERHGARKFDRVRAQTYSLIAAIPDPEPIMSDTVYSASAGSTKQPVRSDDKLLVSRREAAVRLSISQRAIDYLIANKTLTTKRIGSRVLIPTRDLRRFAHADHPERLAT